MNKESKKESIANFIDTDSMDHFIEDGVFKGYIFKSNIDVSVGKKSVEFNNCIFEENIKLSFSDSKSSISFVSCIFKRGIKFDKHSNCDNNQEVIIRSCHIECFTLNECIQSLDFSFNTIGILIIVTPPISISLYSNIIYDFRVFERVCQNDNASFINNVFKYKALSDNKNNIDYEKEPGVNKFVTNERINHDMTYRNAYDAILEYSDEAFDRRKNTKLKYRKRLCSANNILGKIFVFLTGGFCIPSRFILYSFFVIVSFGIAYHMIDSSNTVLHSLYYSGITFTTLGYGEISDSTHKIIKLLSVFEAFSGIILSSCLVTSIINKYVD